ncbi:MAG: hypothetical protein DRR19_11690 [Candidatus Parabeggiatoa sp. nov. 1]|nr:MAG: hypothetical protein DRR19_11690 [Gammaproteobacteria bacterium]
MKIFCFFLFIVVLHACNNSPIKTNSPPSNGHLGVDPEAIVDMANQMVQSLLDAMPELEGKRIIIDAKYFINESSNILNKNLIVDKIRIELHKVARGKLQFISAKHQDKTETPLSAHYRFSGKINSMDMIDSKTGARRRYTQIAVELFDLVTSVSVWEDIYELDRVKTGMPKVYR